MLVGFGGFVRGILKVKRSRGRHRRRREDNVKLILKK